MKVGAMALSVVGFLAIVTAFTVYEAERSKQVPRSCQQTATNYQYDQAGLLIRSVVRVEDCTEDSNR